MNYITPIHLDKKILDAINPEWDIICIPITIRTFHKFLWIEWKTEKTLLLSTRVKHRLVSEFIPRVRL